MKWGKVVKVVLVLAVLIGVPIYLSTDGFLTWLYEKANTEQWDSAAAVTLKCAGFYRWTLRDERAAEVYELFLNRWPQNEAALDAKYGRACALRDAAQELEYKAGGKEEIRAKRERYRSEAEGIFDDFWQQNPSDPRAETAKRAAQAIRDGH